MVVQGLCIGKGLWKVSRGCPGVMYRKGVVVNRVEAASAALTVGVGSWPIWPMYPGDAPYSFAQGFICPPKEEVRLCRLHDNGHRPDTEVGGD